MTQSFFTPRSFPTLILIFITTTLFAQSPAKWSVDGNAISSSDFFGTTNNQPLIFYTNNQEAMRIQTGGTLKVLSLATNGFVTANSSGALSTTAFTNDTSMVLFGDGVFRPLDKASGWGISGTDLYNTNLGNVGIGTNSPSYPLDVNGNARLNGKTYVYRLLGANGDSIIRFGDSTLNFNYGLGTIYNTNTTGFCGIGIGISTFGAGLHSTAIGYKVICGAPGINAVAIGTGQTNGPYFINNTPNSLMVTFNSDIPSFFVGPANGTGTVGRVGIGTNDPQSDFQVGNATTKINAGSASNIGTTGSTSYLGFNAARTMQGQWQAQGNGTANGGVVLLNDINGGFRIANMPSNGGTTQAITDATLQSNTLFYIRSDGRVIVGKDQITPSGIYDDSYTRMTVNGRIMCKDLVVSTVADWPDFVFDSAYALMPMDSLGAYVAYYKHLPGTASAQAQEQNGFSISETCKKQQMQIEELTLYILQLNERLKALEAEKQKQGK